MATNKKELGTVEENLEQDLAEEKTGIQKAVDNVVRGWNRFSTSKGGRWAIRCAKGGLLAFGLKTAYDKGRESVKPTTIYVTPIEDGQEEPEEEAMKKIEAAETETNIEG